MTVENLQKRGPRDDHCSKVYSEHLNIFLELLTNIRMRFDALFGCVPFLNRLNFNCSHYTEKRNAFTGVIGVSKNVLLCCYCCACPPARQIYSDYTRYNEMFPNDNIMFFFLPPMSDFKTFRNVMNERKVLNYNNGRPICKRKWLKCFCGEFTGAKNIYRP